jgi:hypothetical protein
MTNDRANIIAALHAAEEMLVRKARKGFKPFVRYLSPHYDMQWFHGFICDRLQAFAEGKVKNMMILMPPQHGKSELASRLFPAYLFGINPNLRIAVTSYSFSMAAGFNRAIQRNMDTSEYQRLFPETKLNYSKVYGTSVDNYARREDLFELVGNKGSLRAVGRGGSLTGNPVDVGIIDDLYKDREEAMSMTISQGIWQWYVDVFKTRFHNNSRQLIMNTLWSENDLAVRLMQQQPDKWEIIKLPAIKTADIRPYDLRNEGEALWPERHSLDKILEAKEQDEVSFNSLQQQDPKPNTKLLIISDWIEIPRFPDLDIKCWGLDFGKSTGINALVKYVENGKDAYFEECCYEPGLPVRYIADIMFKEGYVDGQPVYCDHIPGKINELRQLGIAAFPAIKGPGSIQAGLDKFKEYKCHYTARSANLRMERSKYQYVTYGSIVTTMPVDDYNHLVDACRYAQYSSFFQM